MKAYYDSEVKMLYVYIVEDIEGIYSHSEPLIEGTDSPLVDYDYDGNMLGLEFYLENGVEELI